MLVFLLIKSHSAAGLLPFPHQGSNAQGCKRDASRRTTGCRHLASGVSKRKIGSLEMHVLKTNKNTTGVPVFIVLGDGNGAQNGLSSVPRVHATWGTHLPLCQGRGREMWTASPLPSIGSKLWLVPISVFVCWCMPWGVQIACISLPLVDSLPHSAHWFPWAACASSQVWKSTSDPR